MWDLVLTALSCFVYLSLLLSGVLVIEFLDSNLRIKKDNKKVKN